MKESDIDKDSFVVPKLFANNGIFHYVNSSSSGFSYHSGIPSMYSSRRGKKVDRGDMNGLVRMMTQAPFFNQSGGYYTFNQEVCDAIGGYPEGAILKYYDATNHRIRLVRSMIPNNAYDFITTPTYIDGSVWSYVDTVEATTFRPRIYPDYGSSLKETGKTLSTGETYMAKRPTLFIIQSGMDAEKETTGDETGAYLWLAVKRADEDTFYTAGMLGYTSPVGSVMNGFGRDAAYIYADAEKNGKYSSFYSSSPIHVYLNTGDVVKITENREFSFTAKYIAYPLKS